MVSKVLKSESDHPINRVFAIFFESEEKMKSFFADAEYAKVKAEFFEKAVGGRTVISQYLR